MIDRRFLDLRLTVLGFTSSLPSLSNVYGGEQYILSGDLDSSQYPDGKKDCIATYNARSSKWLFVAPNKSSTTEVLNLATGEILAYQYNDAESDYIWEAVGYIGNRVYSYVVDTAVSTHAEVQGQIDKTYILIDASDDKVYRVTGSGANDHESLGTLSLNEQVATVNGGKVYTVDYSGGVTEFSPTFTYVPTESVVVSSRNQKLYVSGPTVGSNLASVGGSGGSSGGNLCVEKHVFTASEIEDQFITLSNEAPATSAGTLVCLMGGGVHLPGIDFSTTYNNSTHLINVLWDDYYYNWNDSAPRVGETAIFQYYKE